MIGGAKRQLPPWMVKPAATDQASRSETKEEDKENDVKELDTKSCRPRKKVQRKPQDSLQENWREKRKLTLQDEEGQSNNQDDSDLTNKAKKIFLQGDERRVLKKCETGRRGKNQRISNKQSDDQGDNGAELREKHQGILPRRKKHKGEVILDGSHGVATEFIQSDDELTVDDLISIAEEYVNAERDKDLRKTHGVGYGSEMLPLVTSTFKTGSENDLNARESGISANVEELSATCSLTEPSSGSGGILDPGGTADPIQSMLELFLGPLFKTAEAAERKTGDIYQ